MSSTQGTVLGTQRAPAKTNGNGHAHVQKPLYTWDLVPSAILKQAQFVVQKGKKPYAPKDPTGPPAKWSNPKVFSNFDLACAVFNTTPGIDGIAFLTSPEFAAVDLDKCLDAHGQPSAAAQKFMASLPNSYWEKSSGGHGLHGYFRCAETIENIPPTATPDGLSVEFYAGKKLMNVTGWAVNCAPMAKLKPEHLEPYRVKKTARSASTIATEPLTKGKRHGHLISLAGSMARRGMSLNAMGDALMRENLERCVPPLSQKEILGILQSASKWPAVNGVDLLAGERQDVGNADRLLRYGRGDYGYVAVARRWTVYDGARWPVEDREQEDIRKQAHEMVRALKHQIVDAQSKQTPDEQEAWLKFAGATLDSARISHMLREAQPYATLRIADLDRDSLLVNFLNGTLEAGSGQLREHRREDYITAVIPYDYNPKARCPRWDQFVRETFGGDRQVIEFSQRALGYSLTGTTSEKCIFLANGETNTGKTTLLATIRALMADYAGQIKVESLMKERKGPLDANAQADLADLRGKRFVMTSETGQGQRLREELVKLLSQGQSKYKAVRKYENPFEFPETWKIWMDCNHLPVVRGTDEAIWQRLIVVPFRHAVAKKKQNQKLSQQLVATEAEGILAWMVTGLKSWMSGGLGLPANMRREQKEWRQESDDLNQWVEERCVKNPSAKTRSTELYSSYKMWRATCGLFEESTQLFARKMKEHGFTKKEFGHDKTMYWYGIGMKG
jgi:P4 family phage/plasmid primase-like protien